jgi:hypothetical protein
MSLSTEFDRARSNGWLKHFRNAGDAYGFDAWILMAIASRETNMGGRPQAGSFEWLLKPGDGGHGFGLMQIDARSFPEWTKLGKWKDAREGIVKGAEVLATKRRDLVLREGQRVSVRQRSNGESFAFVMPVLTGSLLLQTTIAAYNAGDWAPYHVSKGRTPERGTTRGDYVTDVLKRASTFKQMFLEATV